MAVIMIFFLFSVLIVSADKKHPETVFANHNAKIDFTETNKNGTVKINTVLKFEEKIKVTITKNEKDSMIYTYDLKNDKSIEAYPLQMGDGEYIIKVWQHVKGTTFKLILTAGYTVELANSNAPFLSPNQYVNFNENSKVVKKAAELTKNCKTDIEKIEKIYKYVINTLEYDAHRAATVQDDYLPSVDEIIAAGKGICFDYAAVLAAMLRSQGIPTKLVIGYVKNVDGDDDIYHAWNKVYLEKGELTIHCVRLENSHLIRIDPTFDSSSKSSKAFAQYIKNHDNYMIEKKF